MGADGVVTSGGRPQIAPRPSVDDARRPRFLEVTQTASGWVAGVGLLSLLGAWSLWLGSADRRWADLYETPEPAVCVGGCVLGVVLAGRRTARRIGWVLVGTGALAGLVSLLSATASYGPGPADNPARVWAAWTATWLWAPVFVGLAIVFPQIFPSGNWMPGPWTWLGRATVAASAVCALGLAVLPEQLDDFGGLPNPAHVPFLAQLSPATASTAGAALLVISAVAILTAVVRFLTHDATTRRQLALVFAATALLVAVTFTSLPGSTTVATVLLYLAIGTAVVRHRLYGVDQVAWLAAAAALVTVMLAAVYYAVVGALGVVLHREGTLVAFVGAASLAAGFDPARKFAVRETDRLFARGRPDPVEVAREVERVCVDAATPQQALEQVTSVLTDRLELEQLQISVGHTPEAPVLISRRTRSGEPDGTRGSSGSRPELLEVPLQWLGRPVGAMTVRLNENDRRPARMDVRALKAAAVSLAAAAHDFLVTRALERSRADVVDARAEERRRLRRELHDNLGPSLATASLALSTLRRTHPDAGAAGLLEEARVRVQEAVVAIRHIARSLRPPALDDLGLQGAIRSLSTSEVAPPVSVVVDGDIEHLPAATEVAAFHIVQEALTNVRKHARATVASIELLRRSDALVVRIRDDGRGGACQGDGIGMTSMRERAAEVGGHLDLWSANGAGTVVQATLPIRTERQGA